MLDALQQFDIVLFRLGNRTLSNPLLDAVMPFLTDLNRHRIVLVAAAALLLYMIIRGNASVRWAALLLIPTILFSDQLSSSFIKFLVERPRPCHVLPDVRLLVGCGSGYAFPSSHAVNNFAAAIVLAYFIPRGTWWFFGFASLVAFSRVYVGVHYPSDVLGGAVIGLLCGTIVLMLFRWGERMYAARHVRSSEIRS